MKESDRLSKVQCQECRVPVEYPRTLCTACTEKIIVYLRDTGQLDDHWSPRM